MGTNGVFEISPPSLSFSGYEVKKTQTRKILVKNVSDCAQRLSILPTSSPYFRVKYEKRGMLAPGMCEPLYIAFTPPEWRYYYDCVRILCNGGNLNIPVHAYPVLSTKERYLPPLLDLGKCTVGETLHKVLYLESTVPVSFEYELKVIRASAAIQIGPVVGEILGNSRQPIEITYEPHAAVTAEVVVELRLSEFDYIPILMKIVASATHKTTEFLANLTRVKPKEYPRRLPALIQKATGTHNETHNETLRKDTVRSKGSKLLREEPEPDDPVEREFYRRGKRLARLVRAAETVVVRLRADKRIKMLKNQLRDIRTRSQAREFVLWECKQAEQHSGLPVEPVLFTFEFTGLQPVEFPEQFEAHMEGFSQPLTVDPLTEYKDYHTLSLIESQDWDIAEYQDFAVPCTAYYVPPSVEKEKRSGAEEEYSVPAPQGASTDVLFHCPPAVKSPVEVDRVSLVRPHATMRPLLRLSGESESSAAFPLKSALISSYSVLEYPGNFQPLKEYGLSYRPHSELPKDPAPNTLTGPQPADLLSDSDSDSENTFNFEIPHFENYLAAFEDPEERELTHPLRTQAETHWCNSLRASALLTAALLPSSLHRANATITAPANKLALS